MRNQDEERIFLSLARDKLNRMMPWGEDERHELLEEQSRHSDPFMRAAAAGHQETPTEALQRLAFDPEPLVVEALARSWHLPAAIARTLAEHGSEEVAAQLAWNFHLDPSAVDILCTRSYQVRMRLTMLVKRSESVYRRLARDESVEVRLSVADSTHCPEPVLKILADDDEPSVLALVALNPNTSAEVLATLHDKFPWLAGIVDEHPRASSSNPTPPGDSEDNLDTTQES